MAPKRYSDIVLVSPDFTRSHLIDLVLEPFDLPLVHPNHAEQHILVGRLEEMDHHFGPIIVLELSSKIGVRLRIPWGHIFGVVTGGTANPKDLGFVKAG